MHWRQLKLCMNAKKMKKNWPYTAMGIMYFLNHTKNGLHIDGTHSLRKIRLNISKSSAQLNLQWSPPSTSLSIRARKLIIEYVVAMMFLPLLLLIVSSLHQQRLHHLSIHRLSHWQVLSLSHLWHHFQILSLLHQL